MIENELTLAFTADDVVAPSSGTWSEGWAWTQLDETTVVIAWLQDWRTSPDPEGTGLLFQARTYDTATQTFGPVFNLFHSVQGIVESVGWPASDPDDYKYIEGFRAYTLSDGRWALWWTLYSQVSPSTYWNGYIYGIALVDGDTVVDTYTGRGYPGFGEAGWAATKPLLHSTDQLIGLFRAHTAAPGVTAFTDDNKLLRFDVSSNSISVQQVVDLPDTQVAQLWMSDSTLYAVPPGPLGGIGGGLKFSISDAGVIGTGSAIAYDCLGSWTLARVANGAIGNCGWVHVPNSEDFWVLAIQTSTYNTTSDYVYFLKVRSSGSSFTIVESRQIETGGGRWLRATSYNWAISTQSWWQETVATTLLGENPTLVFLRLQNGDLARLVVQSVGSDLQEAWTYRLATGDTSSDGDVLPVVGSLFGLMSYMPESPPSGSYMKLRVFGGPVPTDLRGVLASETRAWE